MKRTNREIDFFIANFGELHVAYRKPDERKKSISVTGRESSFHEDLMQREVKVADYLGT